MSAVAIPAMMMAQGEDVVIVFTHGQRVYEIPFTGQATVGPPEVHDPDGSMVLIRFEQLGDGKSVLKLIEPFIPALWEKS